MNMKNWVVISDICNKDSLIRTDNIFNIISQNIVNQVVVEAVTLVGLVNNDKKE